MDLSIAVPIFFATRLAKEEGIKVMLSGQGADEIFGGYFKYEKVTIENGHSYLHDKLWEDVLNLSSKNLERDDAASMANAIEVRYPFLDVNFINYAMRIPPEFKIKLDSKEPRKHILRLIAKNIGLPDEIIYRPKIAAQFGSGSQKEIERIANSKKIVRTLMRKYGVRNTSLLYIEILGHFVGIPVESAQFSMIIDYLNKMNISPKIL